jgi:SAM-dependent MidA family methyltransferase
MVAEAGPEGGQLAADMVSEFATLLPGDIFERLTYVAVEPCGAKREPLRATLLERGIERALVIGGWAELSGARGVVVANEVLDALPVKRYQSRDGQWFELGIAEDGGRFVEKELYEDQVALDFGADAPPVEVGFVVERCPSLRPFFAEISASFEEVHGCFVDYGLERSADFLDPGRSEGTLRAYRDQKLVDDPLAAPGEVDLTTHVDFECACHAAEAAGLHAVALSDQHRFLVHAARGWLLEIEGRGAAPDAETAKLLRQFQSLSHPSAMGMAFNVLEVRS